METSALELVQYFLDDLLERTGRQPMYQDVELRPNEVSGEDALLPILLHACCEGLGKHRDVAIEFFEIHFWEDKPALFDVRVSIDDKAKANLPFLFCLLHRLIAMVVKVSDANVLEFDKIKGLSLEGAVEAAFPLGTAMTDTEGVFPDRFDPAALVEINKRMDSRDYSDWEESFSIGLSSQGIGFDVLRENDFTLGEKEKNLEFFKFFKDIDLIAFNRLFPVIQPWAPLQIAAAKGSVPWIDILLEARIEPDRQDFLGNTALTWAARYNQVGAMDRLIQAGASLELPNHDLLRPIHYAAKWGHAEALERLIQSSIAVDPQDHDGNTPLMLASAHGHRTAMIALINAGSKGDGKALLRAVQQNDAELVSLLLHAGSPLVEVDEKNQTALHLAVLGNDADLVDRLVDAGAPLEARDKWGRTPLLVAAVKNFPLIVLRLLDAGADAAAFSTDKDRANALHWMVLHGHRELVERLLALCPEAMDDPCCLPRNRCMNIAAKAGHPEIIALLLEHGFNVDSQGKDRKTPLMQAIQRRDRDSISILLEAGARIDLIDADRRTALAYACLENDIESIRKLVALGADVDAEDNAFQRPIHIAASKGSIESLKILIEAGARIDMTDSKRKTPLHISVEDGHLECAVLLLESGAATEVIDENHDTPLLSAVGRNQGQFVDILLSFDSNPEARGKDQETPLIKAVRANHVGIARKLLDFGVDLNAVDKTGNSAIFWCINGEYRQEMLWMLLEYGANLSLRNPDGKTAMDLADPAGLANIKVFHEREALKGMAFGGDDLSNDIQAQVSDSLTL